MLNFELRRAPPSPSPRLPLATGVIIGGVRIAFGCHALLVKLLSWRDALIEKAAHAAAPSSNGDEEGGIEMS